MKQEQASVNVTVSRQIFKYAEGADPAVDDPFEVITENQVLTGQEAIDVINQMKGEDSNGSN
jgi:hypothetical protein